MHIGEQSIHILKVALSTGRSEGEINPYNSTMGHSPEHPLNTHIAVDFDTYLNCYERGTGREIPAAQHLEHSFHLHVRSFLSRQRLYRHVYEQTNEMRNESRTILRRIRALDVPAIKVFHHRRMSYRKLGHIALVYLASGSHVATLNVP